MEMQAGEQAELYRNEEQPNIMFSNIWLTNWEPRRPNLVNHVW